MSIIGQLAADLFEPGQPVRNPLAGATQGPDGLWRDATGNIINNGGKPINPADVQQPFATPSFGQRLLTPGIANYQADANANFYQNPLLAQQANTTRNTIGGQNFAKVQPYGPSQLQAVDPQTGYLLTEGATSPAALGQAGTSITQNQMGQPYTTGMANTREEQNRLIGATAAQNFGLPTLRPQDEAGNLSYDVGLNPYRMSSIPNVGATIGNQANIGAATTGQAVSDLPITTGTQRLEDVAQNYRAGIMPDETTTMPYLSTVGAQGVTPSGGQINPNFRPAMIANMAALQRGLLTNGANGGISGTLSTGKGFNYSPPTPTVAPTVGTNFTPPVSTNTTPVDKFPGYSVDFTTGRVFQDGQDVTGKVNPAIVQAAIEQQNEKHGDVKDATHDAAQTTIAAQIAALKAQKAQLAAHHIRSGYIPQVIAGTKAGAVEAGQHVGNLISGPYNRLGAAVGQGYKDIYGSLIGQ